MYFFGRSYKNDVNTLTYLADKQVITYNQNLNNSFSLSLKKNEARVRRGICFLMSWRGDACLDGTMYWWPRNIDAYLDAEILFLI